MFNRVSGEKNEHFFIITGIVPADLVNHHIIEFQAGNPFSEWNFTGATDRSLPIRELSQTMVLRASDSKSDLLNMSSYDIMRH